MGVPSTYRNMVCPLGAGRNGHGNTNDAEEHEDQRPPRVVGEPDVIAQRGGYYRADEGDDPGKLHRLALSLLTMLARSRSTDNGNGDGGQRKGIADDAADAEGRPLAVAVSVFHFAQRRGALGAVRGHVSVVRGERGSGRARAAAAGSAVMSVRPA